MQKLLHVACIALLCLIQPINAIAADPWFTGPLLAPSGITIPRGHTNFEPYGFYTVNNGIYSRQKKLVHSNAGANFLALPILTHGFTDFLDVTASLPYLWSHNIGRSYKHISDAAVQIGVQAFKQNKSKWLPSLRFTLGEVFPTGRYEGLDPELAGIDGSGLGVYQTAFTLNFEHLLPVFKTHYLRTRLSLAEIYDAKGHIRGHSVFGGGPMTNGFIWPGNVSTADLAAEFSVTQHIVAVMETYYAKRQPTQFKGFLGVDRFGLPAMIGHGQVEEWTLAPAVEYNFSANYGIIAGVWYSIQGQDSVDFVSTVFAFNAYW